MMHTIHWSAFPKALLEGSRDIGIVISEQSSVARMSINRTRSDKSFIHGFEAISPGQRLSGKQFDLIIVLPISEYDAAFCGVTLEEVRHWIMHDLKIRLRPSGLLMDLSCLPDMDDQPVELPEQQVTYPVQPRLLPKGEGCVCDVCGRQWKMGEDPGCPECDKAFKALGQ